MAAHNGGGGAGFADLLGEATPWDPDLYATPVPTPGKMLDLSGGSSSSSSSAAPPPASFAAPAASFGSSSSSSSGSRGFSAAPAGASAAAFISPTSIEGGPTTEISLAALNPASFMRELATRPVTELIAENSRRLSYLPGTLVRAYTAVSQRYLRPWKEFGHVNPARTVENLRQASQRGEIQVHLQQNVLANVRTFCPNYAFIYLVTLCMFVCTQPSLLAMLGLVGGGWSHALRDGEFRNRPWTLQVGGVYVPLGANIKMALMSLPTLIFLHFFMGPVLWSATLYSGGISLAHAALRDRDDDRDEDGPFSTSSVRIQELP